MTVRSRLVIEKTSLLSLVPSRAAELLALSGSSLMRKYFVVVETSSKSYRYLSDQFVDDVDPEKTIVHGDR